MLLPSFALLLPLAGAVPEPPAPLTYGPNRTSTGWIDTATGRVPVDQGLEWQGVKVYLTLLHDALGVDVKTNKLLWQRNVGAFWDTVGFTQVGTAWAVELRNTRGDAEKQAQQLLLDLRTGKDLETPAAPRPGVEVKGIREQRGTTEKVAALAYGLYATADDWAKRREQLGHPDLGPIDFGKEIVFVVAGNPLTNCRGYSVESAREEDGRVVLRVRAHTFQSENFGGAPAEVKPAKQPWGAFVLPRVAKPYVVQTNRQNLIGGPALWKDAATLAPPRPGVELQVARAKYGFTRNEVALPYHIITTNEVWAQRRVQLGGVNESTDLGPVDFSKEVVLVVACPANAESCRFDTVYMEESRVVVRIHVQIVPIPQLPGQAWGAFVLPRVDKPYVVQSSTRRAGDPPQWKDATTLKLP